MFGLNREFSRAVRVDMVYQKTQNNQYPRKSEFLSDYYLVNEKVVAFSYQNLLKSALVTNRDVCFAVIHWRFFEAGYLNKNHLPSNGYFSISQ